MTPSGVYKSSRAFQELKNVKEKLLVNMTTSQYMKLYDEYLEKAMNPIIANCKFFDTYLSQLISWQARSHRRKISFVGQIEFPRLAVNFMLQSTGEQRIEAYKKLSLDRGIVIEFLRLFESMTSNYKKASNLELFGGDLQKCLRIIAETETSLRPKIPLISIIRESSYWFNHALNFRHLILEKYIRLTLNAAQRDYVEFFQGREELDDVVQAYLLYTARAIDRCDYRQGALTSHIQKYFLAAKAHVLKGLDSRNDSLHDEDEPCNEYGKDSELQSPDIQLFNKTLNEDSSKVISQLSKLMDPEGYARGYLGIPEVLNEHEIQLLTENHEHLSSQISQTANSSKRNQH